MKESELLVIEAIEAALKKALAARLFWARAYAKTYAGDYTAASLGAVGRKYDAAREHVAQLRTALETARGWAGCTEER